MRAESRARVAWGRAGWGWRRWGRNAWGCGAAAHAEGVLDEDARHEDDTDLAAGPRDGHREGGGDLGERVAQQVDKEGVDRREGERDERETRVLGDVLGHLGALVDGKEPDQEHGHLCRREGGTGSGQLALQRLLSPLRARWCLGPPQVAANLGQAAMPGVLSTRDGHRRER